jgi:hypothetical protein
VTQRRRSEENQSRSAYHHKLKRSVIAIRYIAPDIFHAVFRGLTKNHSTLRSRLGMIHSQRGRLQHARFARHAVQLRSLFEGALDQGINA